MNKMTNHRIEFKKLAGKKSWWRKLSELKCLQFVLDFRALQFFIFGLSEIKVSMDPIMLMGIKEVLCMEQDDTAELEMASQMMQTSLTAVNEMAKIGLIANLNQRETHFRPQGYTEMTENYLPEDHRRLFRMTQETLDVLLHYLRSKFPSIDTPYSGGLQPVSAKKKLQAALLYLSSQQTLRQIGDTLGIADSTVMVAKDEIIEMLCRSAKYFIRWPTEDEAKIISDEFEELAGFPGVIGDIDGCHIPAKFRKAIGHSYINRKMFKSVVLQGVCTSNRFFTHIFVGVPGRVHDARVFRLSNLKKNINQKGKKALFYNDRYHLIGDPAYALTSYMLVRYKHRNLTVAQKRFNKRHSQTRVKIENTFGLLKGRWARTQYINTYKLEKISKTVTACCVLHNFCLLQHDYMDSLVYKEPKKIMQDPLRVDPTEAVEHQLGLAKRLQITAALV